MFKSDMDTKIMLYDDAGCMDQPIFPSGKPLAEWTQGVAPEPPDMWG
jgi:hypothetical protein